MTGKAQPLRLHGVERHYAQGDERLHILTGADLTLRTGEMVALVAPSGAGKSTLLHIAGLLERPDGGDVIINGLSSSKLDDAARTKLRRETIGFVYQSHYLLGEFSALENVMLPQLLRGLPRAEARKRAGELLRVLGLAERSSHRPAALSGGEQQRVAIGRAIANAPRVLLADEPTGNLDPPTAERVFAMLGAIVRGTGLAALVATHNLDLASRMDRRVTLRDGKIVDGE
ncbi:lipoprotein-releasing system ATP-binding protein [Rhizobiales bacterium GAS191]|jgi:lipoprotein-releasing system ATP-binding protein|nr:lipoprotein-releasing system ATP-binding protein [Rhizobiales bacterium GAS113]SED63163.1 lipoprotein-releasing system ATP-binding protein [Rhizobiales bacterium GAS191]SEE76148.1 lipoprotein-releasing system ATP-binding protein [Rhizobiales bacterium GAS188]